MRNASYYCPVCHSCRDDLGFVRMSKRDEQFGLELGMGTQERCLESVDKHDSQRSATPFGRSLAAGLRPRQLRIARVAGRLERLSRPDQHESLSDNALSGTADGVQQLGPAGSFDHAQRDSPRLELRNRANCGVARLWGGGQHGSPAEWTL